MSLKVICPNGITTPGIDIYHGDYIEDINKVLASGVKYVWLKAWEYSIDPSFKSRWDAMKHAGVIRGAYDFFHPSKDPITQAEGFLNTFGHILDDGDLPCALDWEVTDGVTMSTDMGNALKWLNHVEAITRRTPVIYMSSSFMPLDTRFDRFGLWVANYGVNCPHVPYSRNSWEFWQSSGSGKVPGMRGMCDKDVFNGDLDAMKHFIANTKVK